MGYERNDRRFGGDRDRDDRNGGYRNYGPSSYDNRDQGYYGQGSSGYRDRERGYGERGSGGGRSYYDAGDRDRGRSYGRDDNDNDRGFFERAGDEVRSWFGDEDAERRRRQDDRESGQSYGRDQDRYGGGRSSGGFFSGRDQSDRYGSGQRSGYGQGDYGRQSSGGQSSTHDPHYSEWRDRQVQSLDRDYHEYRQHNQSRFENEFASWRQNRQTQRDSLKQVKEHDEVLGSDGEHLGTVDHVRGDKIKLTKNDQAAGGHHHTIPSAWISKVEDGKVTINKTAAEAKRQWTEADDDDQSRGQGLFGRDRDDDAGNQRNLNRSFSGTY